MTQIDRNLSALLRLTAGVTFCLLGSITGRADDVADANARITKAREAWAAASAQPSDPDESMYDRIKRIMGDGYDENIVIRGAHDNSTGARSHKRYYEKTWDLTDIPAYHPEQQVSGTIRVIGTYLAIGAVGDYWREAFVKFQPNVKFVVLGDAGGNGGNASQGDDVSEIPTGPKATDKLDFSSAYETRNKFAPLEIQWATGSYDVPGWSPALAIFVQKDNPLTQVTMAQLDGIFGGARRGAFVGTAWHTELGRGADQNIRTWGQLGLTGEWAEKDIHVYGRPIRNYNIQRNLEREVFHGGDLWNDNLREYVHEVNPDGTRYVSSVEMVRDLGKDKYGIAFSDMGSYIPEVKLVAVAAKANGPYVTLSLDNLKSRTYPLFLSEWTAIRHQPGTPLEPRVREFLRFILSREGQEAIQRDGKWIPLPASAVAAQLKWVDAAERPLKPVAAGIHEAMLRMTPGMGDGADETHKVTDPKTSFYTAHWDLTDLPTYKPVASLSGTLRLQADGLLMMGNVGDAWIEGFRKYHPDLKIEKSKGRLESRQIDVQIGRHWLDEATTFHTLRKHKTLELEVATGSYNVPGWSAALAIAVHKDNPLTKLTMEQIDGIFGGARRGGWVGSTWRREVGRGADKNIRTWGQLGLIGKWADQTIHVYGWPIAYSITRVFETKVFQGGNIWNDSLREYPVVARPDGSANASITDLVNDLGKDEYGITFCDVGSADMTSLKPVAVARNSSRPYAELNIENVRNRSYPLALPVYGYADRKPGQPLDPKLNEFFHYVLSREGQEIVQQDGKWLPLTRPVLEAQLKKLD